MKTAAELLSNVRVASPCPARWEDMDGDDRVRFCRHCQKSVYNFSAMKADEVVELIRAREGRVCARYFQRADGKVLTADCPVGIRSIFQRCWQWGSAAAAFLVLTVGTAFGQSIRGNLVNGEPSQGKVAAGTNRPPRKPEMPMMGKICSPPGLVDKPVIPGHPSSVQPPPKAAR